MTWSPVDGAADNTCRVRYRESGAPRWKAGFPLYFDPEAGEYRGSIVHLDPATDYEIALTLSETGTTSCTAAATWSESFPIGSTITLPGYSTSVLRITTSGTPDGYVLYTHEPGQAATIDGLGNEDHNVFIDASYVIIRGLRLENAARHAIYFGERARDVVIEENDISGWGRIDPAGFGHRADGALHANGQNLARIIVQRNKFHHPRADANSWAEERSDVIETSTGWHPRGPQAINFHNSAGNHVIRYNTVWSDEDHYYNDIFGGGSNCSLAGFPNRDSDIYGNRISHCWDDGIEAEGANRNVRVWGNYIEKTFLAIATRSTSVGPIYVWRNVYGSSRKSPLVPWDDDVRGAVHKGGASPNCSLEESDRGVFVFHNTVLQLEESLHELPTGASSGPRGSMFNTMTRNNIFQIADPAASGRYSISAYLDPSMTDNDFDYDLYNGPLRNVPSSQETNGIFGVPLYSPRPHLDPATGRGVFTLAPGSPGHDSGQPVLNFSDGYVGSAPDMGAHEAGTPPMEFGVNAFSRTATGGRDGHAGFPLVVSQYPNPFRSSTTISYRLPTGAQVNLSVFDVRGRRVAQVVNDRQPAGTHSLSWDARDRSKRALAPGVYFYRLEVDGATSAVRKMVLRR